MKSENNNHTLISAEDLIAKSRLIPENMLAKDFSSYPFSYYTSPDTLEKILSSGYIWSRNMGLMNDIDEAKLHEKEQNIVHALCFCNTRTEGIPMWYMYSGIKGDGVCLRFTPAAILKWIKRIDTVYPVSDDMRVLDSTPLIIGKDVLIQYGWVLYQGHQGEYQLRNKWYLTKGEKNISNSYFIKKYPWNYEREFRVVIINKTEDNYYALAVPVPKEFLKSAKLILGPETDKTKEKGRNDLVRDFYPDPIRSDLHIKMGIKTV